MVTEDDYRSNLLPGDTESAIRSDEELISNAFECAHGLLGLSTHVPYPDKLGVIRLYDNLARQFGGDEELMRHWLGTKNTHLKYTPWAKVHNPRYLGEMNAYLESFLYR